MKKIRPNLSSYTLFKIPGEKKTLKIPNFSKITYKLFQNRR